MLRSDPQRHWVEGSKEDKHLRASAYAEGGPKDCGGTKRIGNREKRRNRHDVHARIDRLSESETSAPAEGPRLETRYAIEAREAQAGRSLHPHLCRCTRRGNLTR
ncbi:hypothetical protein PHSY_004318 [Pseudozyma hubeiensis SY62]|uniref:Uncharacterized protein n=1 Tax=Pseudozyma hubeiensis (strain SY62) TaxID=1305764 RepID=R9P5X7_PSEHS|nr:hypothetical protein PHSY_004318 [Pseudozyma hubeiensis SY62]GAC96734.1 hypothetical protein PHSY_004318 [Pseudozyma hubeiensis SY62]